MTPSAAVQISFFYPGDADPDNIPEAAGQYIVRRAGQYIWVVKTYGLLKRHGYDCVLTRTMPASGIVVTHRDFLPDTLRPNPHQLFVCVVADTTLHPFAQVHILQNAADPLLRHPDSLWKPVYLPHWLETGLLPRDTARGEVLVNVGYFGQLNRFAPQLRAASFRAALEAMGMQLRVIDPDKWYDYSDIDVVLAVRSFASVPFYRHPPSKLLNAWAAGVPALLGCESAYRSIGKSPDDYIEVSSVDDVLVALRRLRDDPLWRAQIVHNGARRVLDFASAPIATQWIDVLEQVARPALADWEHAGISAQRQFFARRLLAYRVYKVTDWLYRAWILLRKKLVNLAER